MGAQDDLAFAEEFRETTGAKTPLMIWDESFSTWEYYGTTGQPTAVLVDSSGNPLAKWVGAFDEAEVLELAASA